MRLAIVVPAIKQKGPVVVARELVESLASRIDKIDLLYFDKDEPQFTVAGCTLRRVSAGTNFMHDYDVVHSHSLRPDVVTALRKSKTGARTLTTVHNYVHEELYFTYNRFIAFAFSDIWMRSWKNKDSVVFLSEHMRSYYRSKSFVHANSTVIHNGRTIGHVSPLSPEDQAAVSELKSRYVVIGVCAVLTKRKAIDEVIALLPHVSNAALIVVGDGPEMEALRQMARELQVADRVLFTGFRMNGLSWIQTFDVYAMCSHSEGFPLVMLESGALGVPILCKGSALFRELFTDQEVSFYSEGDMESMVKAFTEVVVRKSSFASAIRLAVTERYSVARMADSYYSLYQQLLRRA